MAAPQSVKRGLRRVKGLVLVKQWALLLEEEEEEEEERLAAGVDVRFTGWWMRKRSDGGGRAREKAVEAIAVNEKRNRPSVIIVAWLCLRAPLIWEQGEWKSSRSGGSALRDTIRMRVLSHMAEPALAMC